MNGFVPEPMSITVKVVDTSGRLVKILLDNVRYSGRFTLNWNVTDNMGKRVPAGTYFCVLEIGDHMITEKAVVVK
jgi:flagellar hook assembly protein FlgD